MILSEIKIRDNRRVGKLPEIKSQDVQLNKIYEIQRAQVNIQPFQLQAINLANYCNRYTLSVKKKSTTKNLIQSYNIPSRDGDDPETKPDRIFHKNPGENANIWRWRSYSCTM